MWVVQVCRGPDLGEEPVGTDNGGKLGAQDLDGDFPVVPQVLGEIDGGHPALPELAVDGIAAGQGASEWQGVGGHRVAGGDACKCDPDGEQSPAASAAETARATAPCA